MTKPKEVKTTCRMDVTVAVVMNQPWDGNVTAEEVHRVAERDGLRTLTNLFQKAYGVNVVGTPVVTMVTQTK